MNEAQLKNDEKYVRLLMHYMNVFVMQKYFERGPARIEHRVVDIFDFWTGIINSPDFKIYDTELNDAILGFSNRMTGKYYWIVSNKI